MIRFLIFIVLLLLARSANTIVLPDLEVISINPSGDDVPIGNQVVVKFNQPVVSLGQKATSIPISFTPSLRCNWVWLSDDALACNLDEKDKLQPSTVYEVTVSASFSAQSGKTLLADYKHKFITERPKIVNSQIYEWISPVKLQQLIFFNQPVSKYSVENSIYFILDYGAKITVLARPKPDKELENTSSSDNQNCWIVEPIHDLPPDAHVIIKADPGLVSSLGKEVSVSEQVIANFDTFPKFSFVGVSCYDNNSAKILITSSEDKRLCRAEDGFGFGLSFTAPLLKAQFKKSIPVSPPLIINEEIDDDVDDDLEIKYSSLHKKGDVYSVWFSSGLQPNEKYDVKINRQGFLENSLSVLKSWLNSDSSSGISDIFGRLLNKEVFFSFSTDHLKSAIEIPSLPKIMTILSKNTADDLDLYATNLNNVTFNYNLQTVHSTQNGLKKVYDLSQAPRDVRIAVPLEIKKILDNKSGIVSGEIFSEPPVDDKYVDKTRSIEVTPYQMHVKVGYFNTLVWLTDLQTKQPVKNTKIDFYQMNNSAEIFESAVTDHRGIAILTKVHQFFVKELTSKVSDDNSVSDDAFVMHAHNDEDLAIMPLVRNFIIDYPFDRFLLDVDLFKVWGFTAQGIYHPGDTVNYKIFVRNQDLNQLLLPQSSTYTLEIRDPKGEKVHKRADVKLSDFGTISGDFKTSKHNRVGQYQVILINDGRQFRASEFLLAEFTPASFVVDNKINREVFTNGQEIKITTNANFYTDGEAYRNAQVRNIVNLSSEIYHSNNPKAEGFVFNDVDYKQKKISIFDDVTQLDDSGKVTTNVLIGEPDVQYGKLQIQSLVMDERGKYVASRSQAEFFSANRLVGIRLKKRIDDKLPVEYLVTDVNGNLMSGATVSITLEKQDQNSWTKIAECHGKSSDMMAQTCDFDLSAYGNYRISAKTQDSNDVASTASVKTWVRSGDYSKFSRDDLDIISEKEYQVGDVAKFLIANITEKMNVLVTVERNGILDSFVQEISADDSTIELPIKENYAPGFNLSVLAHIAGGNLVDEQKGVPTSQGYIIGNLKIDVTEQQQKLIVDFNLNKEVYKTGDKVKAQVSVLKARKNVELAVAVVDNAVFDLLKNGESYFDPYEYFYHFNSSTVRNYNLFRHSYSVPALMNLRNVAMSADAHVSKAANYEANSEQEEADYHYQSLIYWNDALVTDQNGNAEFEFSLPEKSGSWRIIVVAADESSHMGMSVKSFESIRPIEIIPLLPNQVVEGDSFIAKFSVINHDSVSRLLKIRLKAEGNVATEEGEDISQKVELAPDQRYIFALPMTTIVDYTTDKIKFIITVTDLIDNNTSSFVLPVKRLYTEYDYARYNSTEDDAVEETVMIDKSVIASASSIALRLSSTLLNNLEDGFTYMRDYNYSGFEPVISRAVMASYYQKFRSRMQPGFIWEDTDVIIADAFEMAKNMQSDNGGISYYVASDAHSSPYLSAYTALSFAILKKNGYPVPQDIEDRLIIYLKNLISESVNEDAFSSDNLIQANTRAMILLALSTNGALSAEELNKGADYLSLMSLFGKASYLQAAMNLGKWNESLARTVDDVMAHANESSGKILFTEERVISPDSFLSTKLRDSCALLSSFIALNQDGMNDVIYKFVREIMQSKRYWSNPQESVFCARAFLDYYTVYETVATDFTVTAKLGDEEIFKEQKIQDSALNSATFARSIMQDEPGKTVKLVIQKNGSGRLYYSTILSVAEKDIGAVNSGIEVQREYQFENGQIISDGDTVEQGDVIVVKLSVALPTDRSFVVIEDPVVAGFEPINTALSTSPEISNKIQKDDLLNKSNSIFYYQEMLNDKIRFYAEQAPVGSYVLTYKAQAIAAGKFTALPATAKELYDSDIFGATNQVVLNVASAQN